MAADPATGSRSGVRALGRAAGMEVFGPHLLRHHQGYVALLGRPARAALAARFGHTEPAFAMRRYGSPSSPPWPPRWTRWPPSASARERGVEDRLGAKFALNWCGPGADTPDGPHPFSLAGRRRVDAG
jgi:hypothetical protein